jgi:hypothetical protein
MTSDEGKKGRSSLLSPLLLSLGLPLSARSGNPRLFGFLGNEVVKGGAVIVCEAKWDRQFGTQIGCGQLLGFLDLFWYRVTPLSLGRKTSPGANDSTAPVCIQVLRFECLFQEDMLSVKVHRLQYVK